jgi:hypothetical protein
MTEQLSTLLREHAQRSEPPFLLQPEPVVLRGRRRLRTRRLTAAAAVVVVGAAAAVPAVLAHEGAPTASMDPATAAALKHYDAQKMPATLLDAARSVTVGTGTDFTKGRFTAADSQGESLPAKDWDKASSMTAVLGAAPDHTFTLSLMHSAGEAEGDARKNCANDLAEGFAFSCEVSTVNGDLVTTRVMAMRKSTATPGWSAVTPDELRTGTPALHDPDQSRIDPGDVWFERQVESVHSATFLTSAWEKVKAPDLATAQRRFAVPVPAMQELVTDPTLVIPKPPIGANRCPWMLHPKNEGCEVKGPVLTRG